MGKVYVIGIGMTKFEKPGKREDDYPAFAKEATLKALQDCNVAYSEIQQAFVGYMYGDSTSGQRALYEVGMTGIPIYNVNNNCATGSSALLLAKEAVEFGRSECALALGFEKMEPGSLGAKFPERTNPMDKHVAVMAERAGLDHSPIVLQMFASAGAEYMKKYGVTVEHFAKIAYKNHKHSVNNPNSQFQEEYTLQEILNSPKAGSLLTKLQCCPTSDGAAAAILASEQFVKRHNLQHQAVEIIGMEMATDFSSTFDNCINVVGFDVTKNAAERLFRKANRKPTDVQVVELHDCFSVNELITYDALGLCPPGKAAELVDRGDNTYGGKYVVNPSGGLISKGHPLGATGLAQCAELCWQLRGEADKRQVQGAKLALQHNIGLGGAVVVALYALGFPEHHKGRIGARKAAALNENAYRAAPYLRILEQFMEDDKENLVEKFRGIYGIKIKKPNIEDGYWLINAKTGKGTVEFNNTTVKPDVTLTINDSDIIDFLTGNLNPQKAFFQGKIKIQGNMGLALKLTQLQQIANKKLDVLRAKL